ncbi:MAG: hypothetical protein ACTHLE_19650 [Agriterribacter sp.]
MSDFNIFFLIFYLALLITFFSAKEKEGDRKFLTFLQTIAALLQWIKKELLALIHPPRTISAAGKISDFTKYEIQLPDNWKKFESKELRFDIFPDDRSSSSFLQDRVLTGDLMKVTLVIEDAEVARVSDDVQVVTNKQMGNPEWIWKVKPLKAGLKKVTVLVGYQWEEYPTDAFMFNPVIERWVTIKGNFREDFKTFLHKHWTKILGTSILGSILFDIYKKFIGALFD